MMMVISTSLRIKLLNCHIVKLLRKQSNNSTIEQPYPQGGFTLIELLVVIAILGILATIAFALLNPAAILGQGKDAKRRSDLKQIQNALQQYYTDYKCYPNSDNAWVDVSTFASTTDTINCIRPLVPTYLKAMPTDPTSGRVYGYLEPNTNNGCTDNQAYALRSQFD